MFNILVTGSTGQLGSEIHKISNNYKYVFFFENSKSLDITDHTIVKNFIVEKNINVIINCAAYTAVDNAESEIDQAYAINHLAVENLAFLANEFNIKLIHISTDYVFDGTSNKAYFENDKTNPQSIYGKSKLLGEESIVNIKSLNAIIIRTSWVYSEFGNNFVKTMIRLGRERDALNVVSDQIGSPTYAGDLAKVCLEILSSEQWVQETQIYNYSNKGDCSWYKFALKIMELKNINCQVSAINTSQYPTPAPRPAFSLLDKSKIINDFQIVIPNWEESLSQLLLNADF